jgi:ribosomal protein S10
MIKYKPSIKFTTYSKSQILDICKKLRILGEKDKLNFQVNFKKPLKWSHKNTILKSPHVNKKARDQIAIENYSKFIYFNNNMEIYSFFDHYLTNTYHKANLRFVFRENVYFSIY